MQGIMSAKFQIYRSDAQARKHICLITEHVWERYIGECMGTFT